MLFLSASVHRWKLVFVDLSLIRSTLPLRRWLFIGHKAGQGLSVKSGKFARWSRAPRLGVSDVEKLNAIFTKGFRGEGKVKFPVFAKAQQIAKLLKAMLVTAVLF